jgi:hypothetical protein
MIGLPTDPSNAPCDHHAPQSQAGSHAQDVGELTLLPMDVGGRSDLGLDRVPPDPKRTSGLLKGGEHLGDQPFHPRRAQKARGLIGADDVSLFLGGHGS